MANRRARRLRRQRRLNRRDAAILCATCGMRLGYARNYATCPSRARLGCLDLRHPALVERRDGVPFYTLVTHQGEFQAGVVTLRRDYAERYASSGRMVIREPLSLEVCDDQSFAEIRREDARGDTGEWLARVHA